MPGRHHKFYDPQGEIEDSALVAERIRHELELIRLDGEKTAARLARNRSVKVNGGVQDEGDGEAQQAGGDEADPRRDVEGGQGE